MLKRMMLGMIFLTGLLIGSCWADEASDQTMLKAVRDDDKAKVEALLAQGADINGKDKDGDTSLRTAATYVRKEIAEMLISKGADVNVRTNNGNTPLSSVALSGSPDALAIAELLISKGADVNAKDKYGNSPLKDAAYSGNAKMAELLILHGANINAKGLIGETAMHEATRTDYYHQATAELLIAKGADINIQDDKGNTPLHHAVLWGSEKVAALLITHGANKSVVNKEGKTAQQLVKSPAMAALFLTGSTKLNALVQELQQHPENEAVRKTIMQLAAVIKPAVPAEALDAEARAQYRYANAKSEGDTFAAVKEYMKAIEAAPWVANYYYDLGVILEKTEFVHQALHAYRLFITASPNISQRDAQEVRIRTVGLQVKLDDLNKKMQSRSDLFMDHGSFPLYESGGTVEKYYASVGSKSNLKTVAVKLAINWAAAPPRYELLLSCGYYDTDDSKNYYWTDTQELVNTDRYTFLCGTNMHLIVKAEGEGFVELAEADGSGEHVRSTLNQLFQMRRDLMEKTSPLYGRDGPDGQHVYLKFPQGGPNERYAGFSMLEVDCNGTPLRKDLRALPDDFISWENFLARGMGAASYKTLSPNRGGDSCADSFKNKTGYVWLSVDNN